MARGESWSCNVLPGSIDEDMLEQMLNTTYERSESTASFSFDGGADKEENSDSAVRAASKGPIQRRWSRLGKNVMTAVAAIKHAIASADVLSKYSSKEQCRKAVWSGVLRSLTQRYPGSQLPEKLICTLRNHFDSMPLSYAQAGFDMEQVFHHVRLLEQVGHEGHCQPAVVVQDHPCETGRSSNASDLSSSSVCTSVCSEDDDLVSLESFKVAFACKSTVSRPAITWALESSGVAVKQLHLFEKKSVTLGVAIVQCGREFSKPERMQGIIKAALRRSKVSKLTLGLCGCEGRGTNWPPSSGNTAAEELRKLPLAIEYGVFKDAETPLDFQVDAPIYHMFGFPSPGSLHQVITDHQQTIVLGKVVLDQFLLDGDKLVVGDAIHVGSSGTVFKGEYKAETVAVKRLRGCEGGRVIDVELRKDVLSLISCKHKNVLPLYGICIDAHNGMCLVMKYMEGGSLFDLIQRKDKMELADVIRIGVDIAEGMHFLHERGMVHRDLKSSGVLLDGGMRAMIGDLGVVNNENGDSGKYELGGYRWMAPEALGSEPGSMVLTFMSNVYSFGIILWEMLACELPYTGYSPVQAALGVAAYGLRPAVPKDCPPQIKVLLEKCWASCPLDRPNFSEVLEVLRLAALELPS